MNMVYIAQPIQGVELDILAFLSRLTGYFKDGEYLGKDPENTTGNNEDSASFVR